VVGPRCLTSPGLHVTCLSTDYSCCLIVLLWLQAAGGHVWWDRVMGELAVSRAIGDHCLRPYVIPEPEVRHMLYVLLLLLFPVMHCLAVLIMHV
jgi:hypothetical protein